jgi:hypothetical protein
MQPVFKQRISKHASSVIVENGVFYAVRAKSNLLVSCLAYSPTLYTDAIYSAETLVAFHRVTWRYVQEDKTLQK